VRVVYSPRYHIDLGLHVFPTRKYRLLHDRLIADGVLRPSDLVEPSEAAWDDLARVHTREYLDRLESGSLTREEMAQLELPWSRDMVDGFRLMTGGTILAATLAIAASPAEAPEARRRTVVHLGGGLHHAFRNHGEGFCPFNDVAVAVRVLQAHGIDRVAIVDCDVHHGNGTAFIFESDERVFTFSIHQQHNYPMWKPRGSLDIGLPDGAGDARYLNELERALPQVLAHRPQCVFYLAGADPYEDDLLGGLRLTKDGLRRRDRMVMEAVAGAGLPLVVALAGGYARDVDDTVEIHAATVEEAAARG
jgi:acetoin utilization deacetylase AcuC-like enzyme